MVRGNITVSFGMRSSEGAKVRRNNRSRTDWSSSDAPSVYIVLAGGARRRATAVPIQGKCMKLNRIGPRYTRSRRVTGRR